MYYLETIAAMDLKAGISSQINEVMKLNEYQRSRPKITRISKLKLVFLKNCLVIWNEISYESLWLNWNENSFRLYIKFQLSGSSHSILLMQTIEVTDRSGIVCRCFTELCKMSS